MQVEKFYKAQALRKEITELQAAIDSPPGVCIFDKLNIATQGRVSATIKKELAKIIKEKEKEFISL